MPSAVSADLVEEIINLIQRHDVCDALCLLDYIYNIFGKKLHRHGFDIPMGTHCDQM